jgi:LysM repeat protein
LVDAVASSWQLATVNTGSINGDCTNLIPGQTICLGLKPEEDCSTTYTVAIGDTCENIASNNALNSTILYLNNPQINDDCSNIYIGEVSFSSQFFLAPL